MESGDKPRVSRQFRKRERSESDSDSCAPDAATLHALSLAARARARAGPGTSSSALAAAPSARVAAGAVPGAVDTRGASSLAGGIYDSFASAGAATAADAGGHAAALAAKQEAYVAAQLRARLGGAGVTEESAASPVARDAWATAAVRDGGGDGLGGDGPRPEDILADASRLYEMPSALRVVGPRGGGSGGVGGGGAAAAAHDTGTGMGGMILGGTGIAEVALPAAWRARNADETAAARDALLARRASAAAARAAGPELGGSVAASVTANYSRAWGSDVPRALPGPLRHGPPASDAARVNDVVEGNAGAPAGTDDANEKLRGAGAGVRAVSKRTMAQDDAAFKKFARSQWRGNK